MTIKNIIFFLVIALVTTGIFFLGRQTAPRLPADTRAYDSLTVVNKRLQIESKVAQDSMRFYKEESTNHFLQMKKELDAKNYYRQKHLNERKAIRQYTFDQKDSVIFARYK